MYQSKVFIEKIVCLAGPKWMQQAFAKYKQIWVVNKWLENTYQIVTKNCQNVELPLIPSVFSNSFLCYMLHFTGWTKI